MASAHRNHSGTPLPKKLGIRDGSRVLLIAPPAGFDRLLAPLPPGARLARRAVSTSSWCSPRCAPPWNGGSRT